MEQNFSWEANIFSASQDIPSNFIEPDGSLPRSQQPATCPSADPDQSSPCPPFPTHFLKTHLGETTTPIQTLGTTQRRSSTPQKDAELKCFYRPL